MPPLFPGQASLSLCVCVCLWWIPIALSTGVLPAIACCTACCNLHTQSRTHAHAHHVHIRAHTPYTYTTGLWINADRGELHLPAVCRKKPCHYLYYRYVPCPPSDYMPPEGASPQTWPQIYL